MAVDIFQSAPLNEHWTFGEGGGGGGGGVKRSQVLDVCVGHFGQKLTNDAFVLKKTENSFNTKLQVEIGA